MASPSPPGLEQWLDLLQHLRFTTSDLDYLSGLGAFDDAFLDYLRDFRPRCSIDAVPEGTVVFPHEPVVQVEGPLIEAQFLETALLNSLNYPTLIATKAARIRLACGNDTLVEFGLRRAQGPDGALGGSRAAYIGGADSTSNVLAGKIFGIPVQGTHAHSWVMSFDSELEAFRAYVKDAENPVLLVDTYDTLSSGLPNAVQVFKELRAAGWVGRPGVRLDSGDLARLSKVARRMFKEAGFDDPRIVASNELDADLIADLKRQGAPINTWGVGTHLITSSDHPALGGVYKLVAVQKERRRMGTTDQDVFQPRQDDRPRPQAPGPLLRRKWPAPGRSHPAGGGTSRRHRPGTARETGTFRRAPRPVVPAGGLGCDSLRITVAARHA